MESYYTFPDGGLTYDCSSCGNCCRGKGIGFDRLREYEDVMVAHPDLAYFVSYRGESVHVFNPSSACWFLSNDGRCVLHMSLGWEKKPTVCRLFPFNRVFAYDHYRIIDFNSVICPLTLDRDGCGVRHGDIADQLEAVADPSLVSTTVQPPGANDPDEVIALERDIAELALQVGSEGDLFELLVSASIRTESGVMPGSAAFEREAPRRRKWARKWRDAALSVSGLANAPAPSLRSVAMVSALVPSLRFNELFRHNNTFTYANLLTSLPGMFYLLGVLIDKGETLRSRNLDLRDATEIWNHARPVLYPLARLLDRPQLGEGPVEMSGPSSMTESVRAFATACYKNRGRGPKVRTLRSLLAPHLKSRVSERMALLHVLGPLWGRLTFL